MINNLELVCEMHHRGKVDEFVVTRKVFLEVLDRLTGAEEMARARLNKRHESTTYSFVHTASWHGIKFIYLSTEAL